ncbi:MAG: class I SAM-dependent methyltransferase, partial [Candidatus Thermoplasmatota archaeon]|nr:class I SAM-dependent methyltransferase [Candidatus Thermoplasmatota archaeon]
MIDFIIEQVKDNESGFSSVDVGCGNGWVVRLLSSHEKCNYALGLDGAQAMIEKALKIDPTGNYEKVVLPNYTPQQKFDFIHSMEFLYYLDDPDEMLKLFFNDWLNEGGWAVIGIDHYLENEESLSWPEHVGVNMTTKSIQQWLDSWQDAGFRDISHWIAGGQDGVTLVIAGRK